MQAVWAVAPVSIVRFKAGGLHCPVCAGYDEMRRGQGARCSGFLSSDRRYAHCSRPELAGGLPAELHAGEPTYAHALFGVCRCGVAHEAPEPAAVERPRGGGKAAPGELVATYDYRGPAGELVLQVLRYRTSDGKTFRQRRPDGGGGWVWSVKDVALVPYRLPELLEALMDGRPVYVVEGEKDADALHALGEAATCNVGGAGKWTQAYTEFFRGSSSPVHVVADRDLAGYRHALHVYRSLQAAGVAADLRESTDAKDVSDHLDAGWLLADLVALDPFTAQARADDLEAARKAQAKAAEPEPAEGKPHLRVVRENDPPPEADASPEERELGCTDLGNAERFARQHREAVRYCGAWKTWLVWDGKRWRPSTLGEVERLACQTVRSIYGEAAAAEKRSARAALSRHGQRSEGRTRIEAMLAMAQFQDGIAVDPNALDTNPWLLNVENGTLDLQATELEHALRPHRREDMITKLAPVPFDPDAESELWLNFLQRVLPDADVRQYFQRAVGYSLTGSTAEEAAFFVYGGTASGKSTALEAIHEMLGDYAQATSFDAFLRRREPSSTNSHLARLAGVRFATASEVERGREFAIGVLKAFTSGDSISVRDIYQSAFQYRPCAKVWFAANDQPRAPSDDDATWRRLQLVPFDQTIPEEDRDPAIKEALCAPGPHRAALLAWAVDGTRSWRAYRLSPPPRVRAAGQAYRESQNPLREWVDEYITRDEHEYVPSSVVQEAVTKWCKDTGRRALSTMSIAKYLSSLGFKAGKIAHTRVWFGFRIG